MSLRALNPDILLSTHSTSLAGADTIQQRLDDYRDALAFMLDQTLKGILLGLGPEELRYFVTLPPRLAQSPILIQNYGDLASMPPRIYHARSVSSTATPPRSTGCIRWKSRRSASCTPWADRLPCMPWHTRCTRTVIISRACQLATIL